MFYSAGGYIVMDQGTQTVLMIAILVLGLIIGFIVGKRGIKNVIKR